MLLALCPNAPIVCCVPKWEVFQTDLPHLSFRATMWENQGKVLRPREKILLVVNRKMKLQRKAVMMQSVSCLISPDSSISFYAISAYGPDCACINHTGTAVLSSQEVWLFSLCILFSIFSFLSHFHSIWYFCCWRGTDTVSKLCTGGKDSINYCKVESTSMCFNCCLSSAPLLPASLSVLLWGRHYKLNRYIHT